MYYLRSLQDGCMVCACFGSVFNLYSKCAPCNRCPWGKALVHTQVRLDCEKETDIVVLEYVRKPSFASFSFSTLLAIALTRPKAIASCKLVNLTPSSRSIMMLMTFDSCQSLPRGAIWSTLKHFMLRHICVEQNVVDLRHTTHHACIYICITVIVN